jgi:hypothetical protein
MHAIVVTSLLMLFPDQFAATRDEVVEMNTRRFTIPLSVNPASKESVDRIRLLVSIDEGRSWKIVDDFEPTDRNIDFGASCDGIYWFALRCFKKGGVADPAEDEDFNRILKVFVNTRRAALKPRATDNDLTREARSLANAVEELVKKLNELGSTEERDLELQRLRKNMERLEKRLAKLESRRKGG